MRHNALQAKRAYPQPAHRFTPLLTGLLWCIMTTILSATEEPLTTNRVSIAFNSYGAFSTNISGNSNRHSSRLPDNTHQLLYTNRCDQGEIVWSLRTRTLSGSFQAVAGEPNIVLITLADTKHIKGVESAALININGYELGITPGEGQAARPDDAYANANTPDAPISIVDEPQLKGQNANFIFTSGSSGKVSWRVTFK